MYPTEALCSSGSVLTHRSKSWLKRLNRQLLHALEGYRSISERQGANPGAKTGGTYEIDARKHAGLRSVVRSFGVLNGCTQWATLRSQLAGVLGLFQELDNRFRARVSRHDRKARKSWCLVRAITPSASIRDPNRSRASSPRMGASPTVS